MKFKRENNRLFFVLILFICLSVFAAENTYSEEKAALVNKTATVGSDSDKPLYQTGRDILNFELWSIDDRVVTIKKAISSLLISIK